MEQVKGKGSAVIQFIYFYSFSTKTISLSIDNMEISTKEIKVSIYLSVFVWTSRPVKKTRPQEQKRSGNRTLPCRELYYDEHDLFFSDLESEAALLRNLRGMVSCLVPMKGTSCCPLLSPSPSPPPLLVMRYTIWLGVPILQPGQLRSRYCEMLHRIAC